MTTPNFPDLVARLKGRQAELGDIHTLRDPVADQAFWGSYTALQKAISVLQNAHDLDEPTRFLAEWDARLAILKKAEAEIARQLASADDWRVIADQKRRDQAWSRMEGLRASQRVMERGAEYLGGHVCLPSPLRELMGTMVTPDGRTVVGWYGTVAEVEAMVVEWRERHRVVKSRIDAAVAQAEALLGVTVG